MKALEDERYVVIKAYKFTVFEIWRDFNVLPYIACPRYPYIRVYRLYDKWEWLPHYSIRTPLDVKAILGSRTPPRLVAGYGPARHGMILMSFTLNFYLCTKPFLPSFHRWSSIELTQQIF